MTIIELAKEAGFDVDEGLFPFEATEDKYIGTERVLERFAALVREQTLKDDKDLLTAYLVGFNAGKDEYKAEPVKQEPVPYVDSTPHLHVGDSSFEDWYQEHPKACGGDKQLARDAYAAGMGDPLVAPVERQWVDLTDDDLMEVLCEMAASNVVNDSVFARAVIAAFKEKNK